MMRSLNEKELKWLDSRGGRTEDDVLWDNDGKPFVMMYDPQKKGKLSAANVEEFKEDKHGVWEGRSEAWLKEAIRRHDAYLAKKKKKKIAKAYEKLGVKI